MNTQNILNSKSSQRKESSSRETRIRISFKNHQEGLPTIKRVEPTKPIDVDSGNFCSKIIEDIWEIHDKQTDSRIPWHHPNRSIRTSKIVNLFEDSTINLMSQTSQRSGIFRGIINFNNKINDNSYKTTRDWSIKEIEGNRETIYIKRHLLKTRGITAFTKCVNQDAESAISLIDQIEKQKNK